VLELTTGVLKYGFNESNIISNITYY